MHFRAFFGAILADVSGRCGSRVRLILSWLRAWTSFERGAPLRRETARFVEYPQSRMLFAASRQTQLLRVENRYACYQRGMAYEPLFISGML